MIINRGKKIVLIAADSTAKELLKHLADNINANVIEYGNRSITVMIRRDNEITEATAQSMVKSGGFTFDKVVADVDNVLHLYYTQDKLANKMSDANRDLAGRAFS